MTSIVNQVNYNEILNGGNIKQNNDYIICIPSYKRALVCNEKTLKTLHENKIDPERIYVYVADKEDYKLYEEALNKKHYNKLVIGIKGLVPQRQFIINQWPNDKHIVFFDDDIEKIDLSLSPEFKKHNLDYFIKYAFTECVKHKSYIWGVYAVFNPFFRGGRQEMTTDLNYIVGAFYGIINRPSTKAIQLTITKENGQKEDVERTLKYFLHDGIVLRFNKVGFITKYYGKEGGLGRFEDRIKPMMEASKRLKKQYGEYGDIKVRKNGMSEFVLKKIPAKLPATIEGGKLSNDDIDRYNLENTNVYVDPIKLTQRVELLQKKVLELLENTKIPTVHQLRSKTVGKNGFSFNFGGGKIPFHANGEYSTNKNYPELFKAIVEYGNEILPTGFDYSVITVNKNLKAKKHIDGSNDGLGCITFLGDYDKGGLYIYEKGKPKLYDTKGVVIAFNGAMVAHRTEAFTGNRYALIFYKQKQKYDLKGIKMEGKGLEVGDDDLKIY